MSEANKQRIDEVLDKLRERFRSLPEDIREEMEKDMVERLDQDVFGALERALPLRKRWVYRRIARIGTDQQRWEYLLKNTPNNDAIIQTELAIFRRLYS